MLTCRGHLKINSSIYLDVLVIFLVLLWDETWYSNIHRLGNRRPFSFERNNSAAFNKLADVECRSLLGLIVNFKKNTYDMQMGIFRCIPIYCHTCDMLLCWQGWPAFYWVNQIFLGQQWKVQWPGRWWVYRLSVSSKWGGTLSITNIPNVTTFPNTSLQSLQSFLWLI